MNFKELSLDIFTECNHIKYSYLDTAHIWDIWTELLRFLRDDRRP